MKLACITDGLVRVSVGIEDWRDLLRDFEQALDAIRPMLEETGALTGKTSSRL